MREFNIDDPSVEDVDKALVVFDVLVDAWNIEVCLCTERQLLQGEEMLEDEST